MLNSLLKKTIRAQGNLSIAQFMQHALLHPQHGYYTNRAPFGKDGDFVTSPDISQMFGEMIGVWCADMWQQMGSPKNLVLVEFGPGRGTLMKDCLRATRHVPGFHAALSIHLLEASPKLCATQLSTLKTSHAKISWHTSLETIPNAPTLIIANEFFDALPIQQFVKKKNVWLERMLTISPQDELVFELVPSAFSSILLRRYPDAPEAAVIENSPFVPAYIHWMADRITTRNGAALLFDYGYTEPHFAPTLQAVKAHQYHGLLDDIGEADITAHVDFASIKELAEQKNLRVIGPVGQGEWLRDIGIETRAEQLRLRARGDQKEAIDSALHRLVDASEMGELFKVIEFARA